MIVDNNYPPQWSSPRQTSRTSMPTQNTKNLVTRIVVGAYPPGFLQNVFPKADPVIPPVDIFLDTTNSDIVTADYA